MEKKDFTKLKVKKGRGWIKAAMKELRLVLKEGEQFGGRSVNVLFVFTEEELLQKWLLVWKMSPQGS